MKEPIRIVDLIGQVVAKTSAKVLAQLQAVDATITAVHYEYGHYNDVRERLIQKGKVNPDQKYPLIVLFEDFRLVNRVPGLTGIADLKIIILHTSKKDLTRQQRESQVFLPVLVPIYDEFLRQLRYSGFFMQYGPFRHNRIDRPHWGDPGIYGNKGYLFDDILDGIEISDLQLQTFLANCIIDPPGLALQPHS